MAAVVGQSASLISPGCDGIVMPINHPRFDAKPYYGAECTERDKEDAIDGGAPYLCKHLLARGEIARYMVPYSALVPTTFPLPRQMALFALDAP